MSLSGQANCLGAGVAQAAVILTLSALSAATPAADAPSSAPPAASQVANPASDRADPFEPVNRKVYAISQPLDRYLLRPVAVAWRRILPRPVRHGVHNAIVNWNEPQVLINDLAQFRFKDARIALYRFSVNSTIGLAGALDIAAGQGVLHHENGFAITLGRYGVKPGPYLFIPFLGPSSVRDLTGATVDLFTNPLTFVRGARTKLIEDAQSVVTVIDARDAVEDNLASIGRTATDPYATLRSVYRQRVQAVVSGDDFALGDSPDLPGFPEPPPAAKPSHDPTPPSPQAEAAPMSPSNPGEPIAPIGRQ